MWDIIGKNWLSILSGLGTTILLAVIGTAVGFVFSLILVFFGTQKIDKRRDSWIVKLMKRIGQWFTLVYTTVFRGTPMMVQAIIIYYGLLGANLPFWEPLVAGLVVISLNTAAYIAEVIRGSVNALDKGQTEAGRSIGMSYLKVLMLIVYPQAIKNSLPAIGNEFIVNLKDSSVLNVIGITELFKVGKEIQGQTFDYVSAYTIIAVCYLVLTLITSILVRYLEKRQGISRPKLRQKAGAGA